MKVLNNILAIDYEDCKIEDNNWYTDNQLGKLYPMDRLYCIIQEDPETRQTLYQPKVMTTFNRKAHEMAIKEYGSVYKQDEHEYQTQTFIGPELLSIQYKYRYR